MKLPRAESPDDDPFYQPPAGFENEPEGAILRNRTITASFLGSIANPVDAWQLLYRTTAINGSAIATVTTIFKPTGALTDRFVSFQTAYDSSATICDPSYNYELGSVQTDLISSFEELILEAYLLLGYIVAAPDYEGPDAAFSPGRLEGMGTLDGIRAVTNFYDTLGLSTDDPMVVGVGYSGGAIATGWAASLQPSYASDLNIKGWVSGGTPANLTGTSVYVDGTVFSGFLPAAIDGLLKPSAYSAELTPLISSIATAEGQSKLAFADSNCAVEDLLNFASQSIQSPAFQTLGNRLLYDPTIASVLDQNIMGLHSDETPTAPVFLYHASQDEIIPYANVTTLYAAWCGAGASVKFTTFASGGHLTTEILGVVDAIDFVQAAFAGTTAAGCSTTTELASDLDVLALGAELEVVLVDLVDFLTTLGDQDGNVRADLSVLQSTS